MQSLACGYAGALKLVAEAFPWQAGSQFAYTRDNHNSVLGMRELALGQGATALCMDMHSAASMALETLNPKLMAHTPDLMLAQCNMQMSSHISQCVLCIPKASIRDCGNSCSQLSRFVQRYDSEVSAVLAVQAFLICMLLYLAEAPYMRKSTSHYPVQLPRLAAALTSDLS